MNPSRRAVIGSFPAFVTAGSSVFAAPQSAAALQAVAEARRKDPGRFPNRVEIGQLSIGASYTGRTLIRGTRNVLVRNHLVVEVFVEPAHSDGIPLSLSSLQLRVNAGKNVILPQSPDVVAYGVRNADQSLDPRLVAVAGAGNTTVVWDSGPRGSGPRFPGDPRSGRRPRNTPTDEANPKDPLVTESETVAESAFRGGEIFEPTVGFLYYFYREDLDKVKSLELLIAPDGHKGEPAVLKLK